jgi:hypothetical protein
MAQADYVTNPIRALITDPSRKPSTNPIRVACAGFIADLAEYRPLSIPPNPYAVELEYRADHLRKVLAAVPAFLSAILRDTANLPGRINLCQVDTLLSYFTPDVTGNLQHAAVGMAARRIS